MPADISPYFPVSAFMAGQAGFDAARAAVPPAGVPADGQ
tara:strand:+ start:132 stop:248 length:117 start_codon:yes stop_codon:yes gene_type:complete